MKPIHSQKTIDTALISLFAAIIAVCAWITVPSAIAFTLQTFGIFCACVILGGKRATISVLVYILMGAVGVPVFSNFSGGLGVLFSATGGYIVGFIFLVLTYWLVTHSSNSTFRMVLGLVLGLLVCYIFGTVWFMLLYAKNTGEIGIATAFAQCVLPFIIPDTLKLILAVLVGKKVAKRLNLQP